MNSYESKFRCKVFLSHMVVVILISEKNNTFGIMSLRNIHTLDLFLHLFSINLK